MATVTGYIVNGTWSLDGEPAPIVFTDNENGTYSPTIGVSTVTIDGTLLATAAKQDTGNSSLDDLNAAIGTTADAAWSGTGAGTAIAILKACYAKLATIATNTEPA